MKRGVIFFQADAPNPLVHSPMSKDMLRDMEDAIPDLPNLKPQISDMAMLNVDLKNQSYKVKIFKPSNSMI